MNSSLMHSALVAIVSIFLVPAALAHPNDKDLATFLPSGSRIEVLREANVLPNTQKLYIQDGRWIERETELNSGQPYCTATLRTVKSVDRILPRFSFTAYSVDASIDTKSVKVKGLRKIQHRRYGHGKTRYSATHAVASYRVVTNLTPKESPFASIGCTLPRSGDDTQARYSYRTGEGSSVVEDGYVGRLYLHGLVNEQAMTIGELKEMVSGVMSIEIAAPEQIEVD